MDFVYVRDIAKSNIAALQSETTDEAFNIGNCEETSLKELLQVLLKVNQSNLRPEYREANSVNPVSRRLADITKAKELLHFIPTISLEQGMKELSEWYFEKIKITMA
jgi:UDP-glucose 4-epimerase